MNEPTAPATANTSPPAAADRVDPAGAPPARRGEERAPPALRGEERAPPARRGEERAPRTFEAPIVAVEVFRDRALVTRAGVVDDAVRTALARGPVLLELGGLPLGLDEGSLRVQASHRALTVQSAQIALDLGHRPAGPRRREAERVEALERRRFHLEARVEQAQQQARELLALRPVLPPVPRRADRERFASEDPVAAWLALLELASERAEHELARALTLRRELEQVDDELTRARDELATISSAALRELDIDKRVTLQLRARETGPLPAELRLSLSYIVPGACWAPSYELRVDADGREASLIMNAAIAQVSGEDWRDVDLALSTADLRRNSELPRLGAWRIGRHQPADSAAWRPLPDDLAELFVDYDRARAAAPPTPPPPSRPTTPSRPPPPPEREERKADLGLFAASLAMPEPPGEAWADEELYDERAKKKEMKGDRAAAHEAHAMPAPALRPQPMPDVAAMPVMARRSASPLGMIAGLVSRSGSRAPAASVPSAAYDGPYGGGMGGAGFDGFADLVEGSPAARAALAGAAPPAELLGYAGLGLSGPDDQRARGTLQPLPLHQRVRGEPLDAATARALSARQVVLARRQQALFSLPLPAGARWVKESAGHFAHRYATHTGRTIAADGEVHRVKVLEQRLPLSLLYRTLPRQETTVYRVATAHNPSEQPLLAGPLDVFWGNDYLVTAQLETTAAGARIETSLGLEPRIKVARNVRHQQHEEGLLSGRTVHEETIEIELSNGLEGPVRLEVLERVPISEERKVEIEITSEEPLGERYRQKERQQPVRGGRRWTLELAGGERRTCKLAYRVSVPSGSEIVGGGRRADR